MATEINNAFIDMETHEGADFLPDDLPPSFRDDSFVRFSRSRFSERNRLLREFGPEQREAVERELDGFARLRDSLPASDIQVLAYRKLVWMRYAIDRARHDVRNIAAKTGKRRSLSNEESARRFSWERRILLRVGKWEIPPKPPLPRALQDPNSIRNRMSRAWSTQKPLAPVFVPVDDTYGVKVPGIILRKSQVVKGIFSSGYHLEMYPLSLILSDKDKNPLVKRCEPNTIRYFHLPANNMHWIEELIGRYYGDYDYPPEFDDRNHPKYRHISANILGRKYWTSLVEGNPNDRRMRSQCSQIKFLRRDGETGRNFVIFMPYVYRETFQNYRRMAHIITEETRKYQQLVSRNNGKPRERLINITEQLMAQRAKRSSVVRDRAKSRPLSINTDQDISPVEKIFRGVTTRRSPLGEYLLEVAKIYLQMDIEPEMRLLRTYLHNTPPLHPRRPLQRINDRDMMEKERTSSHLNKDVKVSKGEESVIMVDQLWLYLLDDNTIISSFPKEWGGKGWPGLHKEILDRLKIRLESGEVRSVYDVALIIMNQFSAVLFDRTEKVDDRPAIFNVLSKAVSHVSELKNVAFDLFWDQLANLNTINYHFFNLEATARKYLNINVECELLRETYTIADELRLMDNILKEQQHVSETFEKHLLHLQKPPSDLLEAKNMVESIRNVLSGSSENISDQYDHQYRVKDEDFKGVTTDIANETLERANAVKNDISGRMYELQRLRDEVTDVSFQLKDLLALKQQRASIIEAKYAWMRSEESGAQSQSVMAFTIVTIIFLPLSFMSSLFGMNASDFSTPEGGNSMSLHQQFKLLFPISLGVIVVSMALAFSATFRTVLLFPIAKIWEFVSFVVKVTLALIFEFTYIRTLWSIFWHRWGRVRYEQFMKRLDDDRVVTKIYSRNERRRLREQWEMAKLGRDLESISDRESTDNGQLKFRGRRDMRGSGGGIGIV